MSTHYNAVVIGGGPGGYVCAAQLAAYGLSTALVEKAQLGGTCLNRGCIPTKTLMHTADLYSEIADHGAHMGLNAQGVEIDYQALKARKEEVVTTLRQGVEGMLSAAKVTVYSGEGHVPAAGKVTVKLNEGGEEELTADNIVCAAGSFPAVPPIAGLDLPGVMTSDDILSNVPQLESIIIIGGGVIGMEFASLYSQLGTKVTVLEGLPRILSTMDREIGQSLTMLMKKKGVEIVTGAMVSAVEKTEGGLSCKYSVKEQPASVTAQAVLVAVGRRVALDKVFAPDFMPQLERGRAVVDGKMKSSLPGVWVIGDAAAGYPQLAHAASEQGLAAAADIAGKPFDTDLNLVPGCVYTQPEIASVGLSEAEAKEAGMTVHVGKYPTTGNGKSVLTNQERGFIKIVADQNGTIVGAQLFCARATDMVGELAVAIGNHLTEQQAAAIIRPHPTFEESVGEALKASLKKAGK